MPPVTLALGPIKRPTGVPHKGLFIRRISFLFVLVVLALALALLPLRWLVVLVPGGILAGLIIVRPQIALYLLCFAVPFGSLLQVHVGGVNIGVTEGLIALLIVAWLAHVMAEQVPLRWPRLTTPLLLFIGIAGLSIAGSLSAGYTTSLALAIKEMAKWIEFLAVMLFAVNAVTSKQSHIVVACLLLAGVAQAALGAYQFLTGAGPEFFALGRYLRAYGTFEQPNPYGGYLGLVAPLALALALVSFRPGLKDRDGSSNQAGIPVWLKWLAVGSFVAVTIGIGMSASRGAWLAFGAAFVAVNLGQSRKGALIFVTLILLLALASALGGFHLLPEGITQRLTSFLPLVGVSDVRAIEVTDANYASLERLAFWQAALGMWRERPWLGIGFGNYQTVYPQFSLPKWRMALGHAHNYYLNIAAETGLLGLLAYLLLWGAAVWQTAQVMYRAKGRYAKALVLGALGVLVHIAVHNIVDNLWVHNMFIHVAIVLGLVQSQHIVGENI
jgi:O-antigen ligase